MPDTTDVVVQLQSPIQAHGETAAFLTFRSPKGADLAACGVPPAQSSLATAEFGGYVRSIVSRLANIPPSAVDTLEVQDWLECMATVLGFFRPPAGHDTP